MKAKITLAKVKQARKTTQGYLQSGTEATTKSKLNSAEKEGLGLLLRAGVNS